MAPPYVRSSPDEHRAVLGTPYCMIALPSRCSFRPSKQPARWAIGPTHLLGATSNPTSGAA